MNKRSDGLDSLPYNVLSVSMATRSWNGIQLDVTEFHCAGPVLHRLHHENETRLSVVLEEVGGPCEPRLHKDKACPVGHKPRHMHFAPAGLGMWGFSAGARYVKDATFIFEPDKLSEKFGTTFDTKKLDSPKLRFWDEQLWTLVKLLAEAVNNPDPASQLYGDGLTTAILSRLLLDHSNSARDKSPGLNPLQLRIVIDYMQEHLPKHIELNQLAALVELSQSHFSRAFKASTGLAPYQWQLDERIRRAQTLLIETDDSLGEVADATGFADAVHFGRTFRRLTGATPAAWRNDRKS